MTRVFCVLILLSGSTAQAQEPPEVRTIVDRTLKDIASIRVELVEADALTAQYKDAKISANVKKMTLGKDGKTLYFPTAASKKKAIEGLAASQRDLELRRGYLKRLEAGDDFPVNELRFPPKLNDFGRLPGGGQPTNVREVINETSLLARCFFFETYSSAIGNRPVEKTRTHEVIFWIKGISTKGAADGLGFKMPQVFKVIDTKKHEAVGTVLVLEPIDTAAIKVAIVKAAAVLDKDK